MAPQPRVLSKACSTCKTRRIKCDETRPICHRCARSGRQCTYASDFDLVHRDETWRTARRFEKSSSRSRNRSKSKSASRAALEEAESSSSAVRARSRTKQPYQPHPSRPLSRPPSTTNLSAGPSYTAPLKSQPPAVASVSVAASSSPPSSPLSGLPGGGSIYHDGTFMTASRHGSDVAQLMLAATQSATVFVAGLEVDQRRAELAGSALPYIWQQQRQRALTRLIAAANERNRAAEEEEGVEQQQQLSQEQQRQLQQQQQEQQKQQAMMHPAYALTMPLGELAVCYFAANFMLLPHVPGSLGFYDYLPLLVPMQTIDSSLMYALRACAFGALSNRWVSDSVNFDAIAVGQYTVALAKTTEALKNPSTATSDDTLATVLLLATFENITARRELTAWRSHVLGAAHIVEQREQRRGSRPNTPTERLLFNASRLLMIAHVLSANKPPDGRVVWWIDDQRTDSNMLRAQRFALEVGNLRLEFNRQLMVCLMRRPQDLAAMRTLLLRFQAIDNEVASFVDSLYDRYRPRNIAMAPEPVDGNYGAIDAYPGRIDLYPDFSIAYTFNVGRICRLILSSLIVRAIGFIRAPIDYRTALEYPGIVRSCSRTISDLLASVPFYLGSKHLTLALRQQMDNNGGYGQHSQALASFACGDDEDYRNMGVPRGLAGLLLIWPLAAATGHDCTTKSQRAFIAGRMKHITDMLGLHYGQLYVSTKFRYPSLMVNRDLGLAERAGGVAQVHGRILTSTSVVEMGPPK